MKKKLFGKLILRHFLLVTVLLPAFSDCKSQSKDTFATKKVWTLKVPSDAPNELKKKFDGMKIYEGKITPIFELNSNQYLSVIFKKGKMFWVISDPKGNTTSQSTVYRPISNTGTGGKSCDNKYNQCLSDCGNSISPSAWLCNIECAAKLYGCIGKETKSGGWLTLH